VRRLAWIAVVLVVVQAAVGGLRVRQVSDGIDLTPTWTKVLHALTAQGYLCVLAALSTTLAPWWRDARRRELDVDSMSLLRASGILSALLVLQVALGALGRHGVVAREVHAIFALPVMIVAARTTLAGALDGPGRIAEIRRPAALVGLLAAGQLVLGMVSYFVVSARVPEARDAVQVVVVNLHLAAGAGMLATAVILVVRTLRVFGIPTDERVAAAETAHAPSAGGAA
jgi:hypothetical protein